MFSKILKKEEVDKKREEEISKLDNRLLEELRELRLKKDEYERVEGLRDEVRSLQSSVYNERDKVIEFKAKIDGEKKLQEFLQKFPIGGSAYYLGTKVWIQAVDCYSMKEIINMNRCGYGSHLINTSSSLSMEEESKSILQVSIQWMDSNKNPIDRVLREDTDLHLLQKEK